MLYRVIGARDRVELARFTCKGAEAVERFRAGGFDRPDSPLILQVWESAALDWRSVRFPEPWDEC